MKHDLIRKLNDSVHRLVLRASGSRAKTKASVRLAVMRLQRARIKRRPLLAALLRLRGRAANED